MTELSEVFYSFLITSIIGCGLGIIRMAYKSKCREASCCCIKIVRDTQGEEALDQIQLQRTNSNQNNNV
jgi:hypothetical protein